MNIFKEGLVVVVVNYLYGMVDGMILVELIGCVCEDYCILICLVLIGLDEIVMLFMILVLFLYDLEV